MQCCSPASYPDFEIAVREQLLYKTKQLVAQYQERDQLFKRTNDNWIAEWGD